MNPMHYQNTSLTHLWHAVEDCIREHGKCHLYQRDGSWKTFGEAQAQFADDEIAVFHAFAADQRCRARERFDRMAVRGILGETG